MSCFNCGECCREQRIVATQQELDLIYRKTGRIIRAILVGDNRYKTLDPCPFYKMDKCVIYNIRPCQCRLYHCGRLKVSDRKIDSMNQIRHLMLTNTEYAKWREWMEDEAVKWGNDHGWDWKRSLEWRQPIGSTTRQKQLVQLLRHQD